MISTLHIRHFKNLEDLNISELSRINLISGKNNVGKTSLLEAIRLYISDYQLIEILNGRGEILPTSYKGSTDDLVKGNMVALASFFPNRNSIVNKSNTIIIRDGNDIMTIRFVFYLRQEIESNGETYRRLVVIDNPDDYSDTDIYIGLEIDRTGVGAIRIPLHRDFKHSRIFTDGNSILTGIANLICVNYNYDNSEFTPKLWDAITLTDKEDEVIKALRIVEPNIENLAFLENQYMRNRYPVAKVKGLSGRIPLKSMGDGINHILAIVLAIVNSENGCVIIDEIDNGLHYTVQKQLWSVIFSLAKSLNVQIFATTHSSDCISSFSKVLNEADNKKEGCFIRLEQKNSKVTSTGYSPEELEIVAAQNIEIR